jgi:hypothetical protein
MAYMNIGIKTHPACSVINKTNVTSAKIKYTRFICLYWKEIIQFISCNFNVVVYQPTKLWSISNRTFTVSMLSSLRWLSYHANQAGFYKNPIQLINMGYGALKSIQIMPKAVMTFCGL